MESLKSDQTSFSVLMLSVLSVSDSCNSLIAPSGGTYTLTTNGAVTSALFSCSLGYTLNGTAELTCLEDGTWSESPPLCGMSSFTL